MSKSSRGCDFKKNLRTALAFLFFLMIVGGTVAMLSKKSSHLNKKINPENNLTPAMYFESQPDKAVQCQLCPNNCTLSDGQIGLCKARKNVGGKLFSLVYGRASSIHVDPIEKKPLYHFMPSQPVYSFGTTGCNLRCKFCQNWEISQVFPWEAASKKMTPDQIVNEALAAGCRIIAYTYNEPVISFEYTLQTAKLARKKGLKNVVVSSGFINPKPLRELLDYVDAYKVDLKGFNEKFYSQLTGGSVAPVLENLKIIREKGVWLEIVNLLVTGANDNENDVRDLVAWVKENLGADVPLHFTRFHPDYKLLNAPPTPLETLDQAKQIALDAGLRYVYTGNVIDETGGTTYCPKCKEPLIIRQGFFVRSNKLNDRGACSDGEVIPGIWK